MLHTYIVQVQFKFVNEEMFNKILTRKDTFSVEMIFDMQWITWNCVNLHCEMSETEAEVGDAFDTSALTPSDCIESPGFAIISDVWDDVNDPDGFDVVVVVDAANAGGVLSIMKAGVDSSMVVVEVGLSHGGVLLIAKFVIDDGDVVVVFVGASQGGVLSIIIWTSSLWLLSNVTSVVVFVVGASHGGVLSIIIPNGGSVVVVIGLVVVDVVVVTLVVVGFVVLLIIFFSHGWGTKSWLSSKNCEM